MSVKVYHEVPLGAIDGVNKVFTLQGMAQPGTVRVYHRGQALSANEFSLASDGVTLTLTFAPDPPQPGEANVLEVDYEKLSTLWREVGS